ncbi:hypothetical protein ACFVHB_32535 [Kitasatospora sp. NPDC127111]|uniref:hypothetical protein n=1 Tax=Kitasatospora sp. NPDC127111 TaxID=3345363 RepID=UPI00362627EA
MDAAIGFARDDTDAARLMPGVHEGRPRARAGSRRLGFADTGSVIRSGPDPAEKPHVLGHQHVRTTPV